MNPIEYLSAQDLDALNLRVHDVIDCIESAIRGARAGTVWSAPKAVIMPPDDGRYMMAALAAMDNPSLLAVKTVVLNPSNPGRGLPQINGLVTLLNSDTGLPEAIIDGNWITAVRTAGLSAVAAKHLANPGAASVGFIGCGVQARSHLDAFAQQFDLTNIKLFGRGQANKDALSEQALSLGLTVTDCDSGQQAIEDVDLIVTSITVTGGAEPFLDAGGVKRGAFATITDLAVPWIQDSLAAFDCVTIDDLEQEAALPNKLCHPDIVKGDLAGLVEGIFAGRQSVHEKTAFIFRGHALGDLALSARALQAYRSQRQS